jgi:hypothetical protein
MRRTAKNEATREAEVPLADITVKDPVARRKPDHIPVGDPVIVVRERAPKAEPEQRWSVTSYPFYQPPPRDAA